MKGFGLPPIAPFHNTYGLLRTPKRMEHQPLPRQGMAMGRPFPRPVKSPFGAGAVVIPARLVP